MKPATGARTPLERALVNALAVAIVRELRTDERPEGLNHPAGRKVRGQDERDADYHDNRISN